MRPISHELKHISITADGRMFFDKLKAERHQKRLEKENQEDD